MNLKNYLDGRTKIKYVANILVKLKKIISASKNLSSIMHQNPRILQRSQRKGIILSGYIKDH